MADEVLVLGGSAFVGKHLVEGLVARGAGVTVLNRGRTPAALPDGVARLVADRTDPVQMSDALTGRDWDAVYDVSGFVMAAGGSDIDGLIDLLDGRVGRGHPSGEPSWGRALISTRVKRDAGFSAAISSARSRLSTSRIEKLPRYSLASM